MAICYSFSTYYGKTGDIYHWISQSILGNEICSDSDYPDLQAFSISNIHPRNNHVQKPTLPVSNLSILGKLAELFLKYLLNKVYYAYMYNSLYI